jgi:tetratricopeptide (TPR) repeat protein
MTTPVAIAVAAIEATEAAEAHDELGARSSRNMRRQLALFPSVFANKRVHATINFERKIPVSAPAQTSPEHLLRRAMEAKAPDTRARLARRGLATRARLDRTTHAMLLRQLYLALFERHEFEEARRVAESAIELGVLRDVLHHDAARAAHAEGAVDDAVEHLRAAARRAPASRRALHWWTLGSTLMLAHRYTAAIAALERAVRWGTHERPLYRAHLALARLAAGERVTGLQAIIDDLSAAPCGQGYGRYVLGHLAYATGHFAAARRYLESFVRRTRAARGAMQTALLGELEMSLATLEKISPARKPD